MTNATPLVSVVMPAYNAEQTITESIASVLVQTYPHWELLVVDDGSTDDTVTRVQAIADSRIRQVSIPKSGINSAVRNAGLQASRGDFIAFLDADDLYEPDALAALLAHLHQHADCTAVYGYFQSIDADGAPLAIDCDHLIRNNLEGNGDAWQIHPKSTHTWENLFWRTPKQLQGLMVRRKTLERVGLFDEDLWVASDAVYYFRLFFDNFEGVQSIARRVFRYRVYAQSITQSPDRFRQTLASIPVMFARIFDDPRLPASIKARESDLCARIIGEFYAKTRLKSGLNPQARQILHAAWRYPGIRWPGWLRHCAPLWWQTWVPHGVYRAARNLYRRMRPS